MKAQSKCPIYRKNDSITMQGRTRNRFPLSLKRNIEFAGDKTFIGIESYGGPHYE